MPLILPGNVASATADAGYSVANSCRFEDGDSPMMQLTPGSSATSSRKMTISFWCKRGNLGMDSRIFSALGSSSSVRDTIYFTSEDKLYLFLDNGGPGNLRTNRLFRDVGAWYHIVIAIDTTQSTDTNRVKFYVNGIQETSFDTGGDGIIWPDQNYDIVGYGQNGQENTIGADTDGGGNDNEWDGYLAEFVFIDGLALAPTSFGEFNEDSPTIWQPIDVSGLTFGTNGTYLDFEASDNLGNDANGGTDWTETNLAATDQSTDTPTNNFSTINSLDNYFYAATLSEGNLVQTANAGNYSFGTSTFGVSSGKWVVEVKISTGSGGDERHVVGITDKVSTGTTDQLGDLANAWQYSANGYVYNSGSDIGDTYDTYTTDDIIGIYLDLDNNKLYFSKNGTVQNSGTGISITAPSSITNGVYFIAFGDYGASDDSVNNVNFGSPPYANSSSVTDGDYGDFEYNTTITGDSASKTFKALCTKNLAEYG